MISRLWTEFFKECFSQAPPYFHLNAVGGWQLLHLVM